MADSVTGKVESYTMSGTQNVRMSAALYAPPQYMPQTVDLNISFRDLENDIIKIEGNIATLKSALSTLKSNWQGVTKTNIAKLQSSWAGDDCAAYITKVSNMNKQVSNAMNAIELLIKTYERARERVLEQQRATEQAIRNIN